MQSFNHGPSDDDVRQTGTQAEHSTPSARSSPVLRRLNGRPQACDPCRSRKVACDNAQPVCRRCVKRRESCVYTISDQTSHSAAASARRARQSNVRSSTGSRISDVQEPIPTPTARRSTARSRAHAHNRFDAATSTHPIPVPNSRNTRRASSSNPGTPPERPTPRLRTTLPLGEGYLGFISYSNIFDEARNTLSLLNSGYPTDSPAGDTVTNATNTNPNSNNPTPASAPSTQYQQIVDPPEYDPLPPATRGVCLHVLHNLPNPNDPNLCKPTGRQPASLWGRNSAISIIETLRRKYGSILGSNRSDAKLEHMAREICANSAKPFNSDLEDPKAFLDQFAGDNLRWESLGLLFTFREFGPDVNGSGMQAAPPKRGWDKKVSHELWSEPARQCLRLCLVLAKTFSDGNTIAMYLCIRQMVVDSLVYGDASLDCWLSHGSAVAVATFLGMHALPDPPDYKPSLASEIKRRLFSNLFTLDKVSSSFHGRPPLLSYRYATSPAPLDLRDEVLMAGGEELERAVQELDEDGWARDGFLDYVTLLRARRRIAVSKDELMELALSNAKVTSLDIIRDIQKREQQTFDSFPACCKYRDEDLENLDLGIDTLFSRLLLRLEHLQTSLIAERLIAKNDGPDDGSLLFISFEMVRHVLVLWMHVDRFEGGWGGARVDFLWIVMSFGAPAGGVLCMELLFPTLPNRPIPYTSPSSPRITRSAIIQQLSLLVGFLGWVGPSAPNREHTANCKRLIQSVLDYTLNASGAPLGPGRHVMDGMGMPFEVGEFDLGFDQWGTFDWFRTEDGMPGFN